jgi:hypothetical protein
MIFGIINKQVTYKNIVSKCLSIAPNIIRENNRKKTQKVYHPAVIWQKNIISLQQINKQFKQPIYESNN